MDREALRREIVVKLAVSLAKHNKPGWGPDLGTVTDELLAGPLAPLLDVVTKAEALLSAFEAQADLQITWSIAEPLLALRAAVAGSTGATTE